MATRSFIDIRDAEDLLDSLEQCGIRGIFFVVNDMYAVRWKLVFPVPHDLGGES